MRHSHRVAVAVALIVTLVGSLLLSPEPASAQRRDRDRTIRVGNMNLLVAGAGYNSHDHPTFQADTFVNIAYQRRVLRREMRLIPIWARGAVYFTSEDRDYVDAYTIWRADAVLPSPDDLVQERTSDFGVRVELLGDLVHSKNMAIYAGGGLTVHVLNFSTRGGSNSFEDNDSPVAPSAVAGARFFLATKPYSAYAEARYGYTYGRFEYPEGRAPRDQEFEFVSVNSVSPKVAWVCTGSLSAPPNLQHARCEIDPHE